ncbi:terminase small subunit [Dyadobacter sp. CY261]|uniref:terminase small subunit n=1 Tax=Dyadobacter sp. CY261 TaxID=2907203 RepID=UPI001F1E1693|nr:terminase small subunit [Dyadobacter sp. CY261]MCF0074042.1 terminase small subunit [Dyadobacter sp. CY261]
MALKKKNRTKAKRERKTATEGTKLTLKQQRFVEEYTIDFNATAACIRAGYSERTAAVIGSENIRKPNIKKAIDDRVKEFSMSANEALIRMSDFARGNFTPFLVLDDFGNVSLDLSSLPAQRSMHLIKKMKQTKKTYGEDVPITEVHTEIEIHDAKDAVKTLLQMHGKLIDKKTIDHTSNGLPIEKTEIVFGKGSHGEASSTE